jgi:hypothetical protein
MSPIRRDIHPDQSNPFVNALISAEWLGGDGSAAYGPCAAPAKRQRHRRSYRPPVTIGFPPPVQVFCARVSCAAWLKQLSAEDAAAVYRAR